jgi:hypothetical protein
MKSAIFMPDLMDRSPNVAGAWMRSSDRDAQSDLQLVADSL